MHEAGAAQAIVKMLVEEAALRGASRVSSVKVVAGEAASYMEESLAFYLGFFAKGTPVEGASLTLKVVKPRLKCRSCGLEFERRRFSFECPECGGESTIVELATKFFIESADFVLGGEAEGAEAARSAAS